MDNSHLLLQKTTQLFNFVYPPRCLCCGKPGQRKQNTISSVTKNLDLCKTCETKLPWLVNACQRCALPLPDDAEGELLCGRCLKKAPFFQDSFSLFSYKDEAVQLIHMLKFHDKLAVARLLGELMAQGITHNILEKPDCLLPVPLYKARLKQRGFNQSIEIARALKKAWGVHLDVHSVVRIRDTQSQVGLDVKQRRKNIKGAFSVAATFNYKHVAIIDDVVTTTSTVNELARVLKQSGVNKISVYSIARAV